MTAAEKATVWAAVLGAVALGFGGYQAGVSTAGDARMEQYEARLEQLSNELQGAQAATRAAQAEAESLRTVNREALRGVSSLLDSPSAPGSPSAGLPATEAAAPAPAPVPAQNCASNLTFQCATLLGMGSRDSDTFGRDERYYRFDIGSPGSLTFTLDPMPNTRWVAVTIYDSLYQQVAFKRFEKGQPGSFRTNLRQPGRYYAKLNPSACCSGAPYDYTFSVSR